MATDESLNRATDKSSKGTTHRSGNENASPEDFHAPEPDFRHQDRPLDDSAELPDGDRECGPRSDAASEFWSQGVAKWRANDKRRIGDLTALTKKPVNPPAKTDIAESALARSKDPSCHSWVLGPVEFDSASPISSEADHFARPVPNSSTTVLDETLHTSTQNRVVGLAPDNARRDQPAKPEAQKFYSTVEPRNLSPRDGAATLYRVTLKASKRRSPISPSVSIPPTGPSGSSDYRSLMGTNAISLRAGRTKSIITDHLEYGDGLQSRAGTETPKPSIHTRLIPITGDSSPPSPGSAVSHKQRQIQDTSFKSSPLAMHDESSSLIATLQASKPSSVVPITPLRAPRSMRPKFPSAEAAAFSPSASSRTPATPMKSHTEYFSRPFMPNTPLQERRLGHSRQLSVGPPSRPIGPRFLQSSEASSQHFTNPRYPEPHQHTPEERAQYFDIRRSVPHPVPASFYEPLRPSMPRFPSSMSSFANNTIYQNAQLYQQGEHNAEYSQSDHFDAYGSSQGANSAHNPADLHQSGNLYIQETNGYGPRYYSNHADPAHQVFLYSLLIDCVRLMSIQLNQNLYSPLEPHREPSKANQRTARDSFLPEDIRLKLQSRTEATLRVFAGRLFVKRGAG